MMNNLITNKPSMTSLEISELVNSRHDSVKRTIERLVDARVIVQPPLVDEPGTDSMGRPRTMQVFRFTDEQGKRDSIIVVAQLSPEFTAAGRSLERTGRGALASKITGRTDRRNGPFESRAGTPAVSGRRTG